MDGFDGWVDFLAVNQRVTESIDRSIDGSHLSHFAPLYLDRSISRPTGARGVAHSTGGSHHHDTYVSSASPSTATGRRGAAAGAGAGHGGPRLLGAATNDHQQLAWRRARRGPATTPGTGHGSGCGGAGGKGPPDADAGGWMDGWSSDGMWMWSAMGREGGAVCVWWSCVGWNVGLSVLGVWACGVRWKVLAIDGLTHASQSDIANATHRRGRRRSPGRGPRMSLRGPSSKLGGGGWRVDVDVGDSGIDGGAFIHESSERCGWYRVPSTRH